MRRKTIYSAILALSLVLTACGSSNNDSAENDKAKAADIISTEEEVSSQYEESSETAESSEAVSDSSDDTEESKASEKKPAHLELGFNGDATVTDVLLIPHEQIDISDKVGLFDEYGSIVPNSELKGIVGSPVEVYFDPQETGECKLVFVYDPEKLYGVRPDALAFVFYDLETRDEYVMYDDGVVNTDNCSVTIDISKPGDYMLVNKYQWPTYDGDPDDDGYEEGYDPKDRPINSKVWENNRNTGDILSLIDEDYIKSARTASGDYYFWVGTPQQLASAVYVVNCMEQGPDVTVELIDDIDLEGYEWAPMGWRDMGILHEFTGSVKGNGHTIKNMHISDGYYVGFIGICSEAYISDIHFENAYVGGLDAAILAGYPRDTTIVDCSVEGVVEGSDSGTLVAYDQNNDIQNCTADVILNAEKVDNYLSYTDIHDAEMEQKAEISETIWLDDEGRPCREPGLEGKYTGLGWRVKYNGKTILERNAQNETTYEWHMFDNVYTEYGEYEICLEALVTAPDGDSGYVPISNTVTFTVDENTEFIPYSSELIYEES